MQDLAIPKPMKHLPRHEDSNAPIPWCAHFEKGQPTGGFSQGRNVYNKATGYTLFHQSVMPLGRYRSRIMERVPAALLLYFASYKDLRLPHNGKPSRFLPIIDYVERHREEIEERARRENRPIDFFYDFTPKG